MSCKRVIKGVKLPQEFVSALSIFPVKFTSASGLKWFNYGIEKLADGTLLPVVCKFPCDHVPSPDKIYNVVAEWLRGERAGSEAPRATLDHWQILFYPAKPDPETQAEPVHTMDLHFLVHTHDQIPGFKREKVGGEVKVLGPEDQNILRFLGVQYRGLLYFMPVGTTPVSQVFDAHVETIWEGPVVVQVQGDKTMVPGAEKIVALDADEQSRVVYDKRRNWTVQVAQCRHTRKTVGDVDNPVRAYEYYTLYDLPAGTPADSIQHVLTNDGIISVDELESGSAETETADVAGETVEAEL